MDENFRESMHHHRKGRKANLRSIGVMRRLIISTVLLIMLPFSFGLAENILQNGDFQELDEEGCPEYWYTDAYILDPGYTVFSINTDKTTRENAIEIRNIGSNDARYAQVVEIEPDTLYCFSGDILADGIEDGHGANLSVEGIYAFSDKLFDTEGKWVHIEYYGETGPEQDIITVFARLGGYSGESTGKASFRNLSLEKVDSVPGDAVADLWFRETDYIGDDEAEDETDTSGPAWPWLLVIAGIYTAVAAAAVHYLRNNQNTDLQNDSKSGSFAPALILLLSLALRILLSANITGYMVDVNCFLSWGHTFASVGPVHFYEATNFCDYPPLYTYVLGMNSRISDIFGSGEAVSRVVFRLIPSLCDLAACWILYRLLLKRGMMRKNEALLALSMLAFHPAMILNSAAWGQMDGVLCLLIMCVALLAIDGKWTAALPLYVVSVLIKPQALMLGPLGLTYIIKTLINEKDKRMTMLKGTVLSLAVLAAGVIPFSISQNWDWLIQLYARTLGSYPYATVNTANFYYLLGGNWVSVEAAAYPAAPVILGILCLAYGGWWMKRAGTLKHSLVECVLSAVFAVAFFVFAACGASWAVTGGTAMAFAFMIVLSHAVRGGKTLLLSYLGALLFILLYVFGVKMHERYLFPAVLLLAAAWILLRDRRILVVLTVFSATLFMNEGIVLDNSIRLGSSLGHLNRDTVWLADIISITNIIASLYAVYVSIDLLLEKQPGGHRVLRSIFPVRDADLSDSDYKFLKPDRSLHWNRKDTLILTAIILVFSAVSLQTLGSTKAPQTEWVASSDEEQIVFDLGKEQHQFSILYFAQVSRYDFSFAVSNDRVNWSEEYWAQMDQGLCWKWRYLTESGPGSDSERVYYNSDLDHVIRLDGRYVRLTAHHLGLTLNEIIFRDSDGNNIPAGVTERKGYIEESELYSDPERLTDEQNTLEKLPVYFADEASQNAPAQPCWWNSTYFDEIYHARTAFEFIKGSVPYETSHPPLGKVLMSASVAVFGMTPFGWRFAGALAGILMLPGMYLLGKQLTKRTSIATFACLFMALDCMHLTQTQIATIDSFPVLFIIFAYFFMLRFIQTDIFREKPGRILPDLAASGIFMGFSIANKWIGIYAGGGLAILFFWHCFRSYRFHAKDKRAEDEDKGSASGNTRRSNPYGLNAAWKRILIICAWCILFFIIIPVLIYLLSYIPYMAYNRRIAGIGDYLSEVWKSQIGMFSYHSTKNLGMDHPFYSPWWQWPVIGKPMYYAAEQYLLKSTNLHYSIFCFGNPVVWFGGLAALLYCFARALAGRRYRIPEKNGIWHLKPVSCESRYMFIFTGILAQYLPWVLVPRGTYIYHYFASLPFLMLALSICFDERKAPVMRRVRMIGTVITILAAIAFIVLFPYASGILAPSSWLDLGRKILRIWY